MFEENIPRVRIYDLAKELKIDMKFLIEELRGEGADVTVPSHLVSKTLANKIRTRQLLKSYSKTSRLIKIKKPNGTVRNLGGSINDPQKSVESPKFFEQCKLCFVQVLAKNLDKHLEKKCPERPHIFKEDLISTINESETHLTVENISWTLLPKGEWLFSELTNHFRKLNLTKKWKNKIFDEDRLKKIEKSLKPNKCYVGKDEFDGYVVYCFSWTFNVVLECPTYGNAIYIIKRGKHDWQQIAKATKWEARTKYSDQVKVINHSDTWLERLKQNLKYRF